MTKELVLRDNVGPANSIYVSEICLKSVRKLSVTKKLSENYIVSEHQRLSVPDFHVETSTSYI